MASRPALMVVGPDGQRPFMRGILVQSLVSRGVPFEAALEVANDVRSRVAEVRTIPVGELSKLVTERLGDRDDLELKPHQPDLPTAVVRDSRGSASPFSKGLLAVSLLGAGMDTGDAHDAARELEARLLREGRDEIDRSELRELVAETVERVHGPRTAQRYRIWRQARDDGRPIFLLLGGSTGVGKTSIAVEMARRLEISRVMGTDSIRQIMRLMFSADLMPEIHTSTYEPPGIPGVLEASGPEVLISGFREQAQKICVGVHALLDRAVEENTSMIIEGVNLLPSLLELERYRDNAHVISLVVTTLDETAWADRFRTRAARERSRVAERYLDHFEAIRTIQEHILQEADQFGLPIIDNVSFDEAVVSAIRSVIAPLKKSLPDGVPETNR